MWKMRIKNFIAPIFLLLLCSSNSFQLTKKEIRRSTEMMLKLHVEYKEFSSLLARRSLKLYIEHFDPEKIYLLADEALPFLDPTDKTLKSIVSDYPKDDFSKYEALNQVIQKAIVRSRKIREENAAQLIKSSEVIDARAETHLDFVKDEKKLRERIKKHQAQLLMKERQYSHPGTWGDEQKQMALNLWERRFHRMEDTYLFIDANGKTLSAELTEHLLCMHILKSIAKSLDAHTSYYSPEEAFEMRASLEKQFEGIGVMLREGIEGVCIVGLIKGGPAERSGRMAVGDVITAIDGKATVGFLTTRFFVDYKEREADISSWG